MVIDYRSFRSWQRLDFRDRKNLAYYAELNLTLWRGVQLLGFNSSALSQLTNKYCRPIAVISNLVAQRLHDSFHGALTPVAKQPSVLGRRCLQLIGKVLP